jgi:HlyD family secretion protein
MRSTPFTSAAWFAVALTACSPDQHPDEQAFQGIVDLESRSLAFEVPGRVLSVEVTRGQNVEQGDKIAVLDDTLAVFDHEAKSAQARAAQAELDLLYAGTRREDIKAVQAQLKAARAQVALQYSELNQVRSLLPAGHATQEELDRRDTTYRTSVAQRDELTQRIKGLVDGPRAEEIRAAVARAEAAAAIERAAAENIRKHVLKADAAAEVVEEPIKFGEFVNPGTPVVVVADTGHPYVDIFVPQGRISEVTIGAAAAVRVDSLDLALSGHVEYIGRTTEFTPRFLFSPTERPALVLRVRVEIEDPDGLMRAGVPAFVTLGG